MVCSFLWHITQVLVSPVRMTSVHYRRSQYLLLSHPLTLLPYDGTGCDYQTYKGNSIEVVVKVINYNFLCYDYRRSWNINEKYVLNKKERWNCVLFEKPFNKRYPIPKLKIELVFDICSRKRYLDTLSSRLSHLLNLCWNIYFPIIFSGVKIFWTFSSTILDQIFYFLIQKTLWICAMIFSS